MRRRSYRYRPNKVQSAVGIAAGGLFILLGLFFVIPTFGFFGIIWTLFAVGITASRNILPRGRRVLPSPTAK